jgi:hypothetical protein
MELLQEGLRGLIPILQFAIVTLQFAIVRAARLVTPEIVPNCRFA